MKKNIEKKIQSPGAQSAPVEAAANAYAEERARTLARGKKYGLRTEFRRDCMLIMAVLSPWLLSWKEASGWSEDDSHMGLDGRLWCSQNWSCDTDVEFVIAAQGPQLNELRWLINAVVDCHVAAQSIAPLEAYTGERMDYELFDEIATPPSNSMLKKAIASLKEQQETCALFSEIQQETIERCHATMGDEGPYRRRIAKRSAKNLASLFEEPALNSKTLERLLYANMTFDKAGAHISMPKS